MAYDEDLACRIRELVDTEHGVEEKRMFDRLMVRVPPNQTEKLLARDHVEPMVMAGHETADGCESRSTASNPSGSCRTGSAAASTMPKAYRPNRFRTAVSR
jgi:hypothetical protein